MAPVHHDADDGGGVHVCGDGNNSGGDDDFGVHGGDGYGGKGFTICCQFDCGDPEWCGNISDGF